MISWFRNQIPEHQVYDGGLLKASNHSASCDPAYLINYIENPLATWLFSPGEYRHELPAHEAFVWLIAFSRAEELHSSTWKHLYYFSRVDATSVCPWALLQLLYFSIVFLYLQAELLANVQFLAGLLGFLSPALPTGYRVWSPAINSIVLWS